MMMFCLHFKDYQIRKKDILGVKNMQKIVFGATQYRSIGMVKDSWSEFAWHELGVQHCRNTKNA